MDHSFTAILWIVICVLLPLLPAIIIFKLFPKTPMAMTGTLKEFNINTGGAFGAYFVVLLLMIFYTKDDVMGLISNDYRTWKVEGKIVYQDKAGNTIRNQNELIELTQISFTPFILEKSPAAIRFIVTGLDLNDISLHFFNSKENFEQMDIKINDTTYVASIDKDNHKIKLKTIYIEETSTLYTIPQSQGIHSTESGPPIN